jgi:chromosome segregation ATPase
MKRKRSKPSRQKTPAVSRRPYATAEKLKKLENKIGPMRRRIDELDGLSSKLGTAIDEINEIKLQLETITGNVAAVRADVNSLLPYERDSGTRASTLGVISQEGRIPIDRNAVKDAGSLLKKT